MKSTSSVIKIATTLRSFPGRFILVMLTLASSMLLPQAYAVSPAPDGGYPGFNTAEGQNALLNLDTTTGFANTAVGSLSLESSVGASFNTGVGAGTLSLNTGNENTAVGAAALLLNTTGESNTAVGVDALLNNTTGSANTANGACALFSNTGGNNNTATGVSALQSNTTGFGNTANGSSALFSNTDGGRNTANGEAALFFNTTGDGNTANGALALSSNTEGNNNTANGTSALFSNTTGEGNTATGSSALQANSIGGFNTANGVNALLFNTQGESNVADGSSALLRNTTGTGNTGVGDSALANISTGNANTALGDVAGFNLTTGDNNIDIGFNVQGVAGESNTIRIGDTDITDTFIRGISGTTVASGAAVLVAANGHLGTVTSSARFKDDIKPMDQASQMLFSLNPVTFRYKKEIDPVGTLQFGLVAEEVEKINRDLVVRDERGRVNSVRYEQINAMVLNEFLKEHKKVAEQEVVIAQLRKDVETVVAHAKEQDSRIKKVSAQIEMNKPLPQVVANTK